MCKSRKSICNCITAPQTPHEHLLSEVPHYVQDMKLRHRAAVWLSCEQAGSQQPDLGAKLGVHQPAHRQVITGVTEETQIWCHMSASKLSREVCQHMLGYEITEMCCYFGQLIAVSCPWNMPYFLLQPQPQNHLQECLLMPVRPRAQTSFLTAAVVTSCLHHRTDLEPLLWKDKGVGNMWQIIFYMVFSPMMFKHITVWCYIYLVKKQSPPSPYVFLLKGFLKVFF